MTTLYDRLESHLRALDTLGKSKEKFAVFLSLLYECCFLKDILKARERYLVFNISYSRTKLLKRVKDLQAQEIFKAGN